MKSTAGAAQLSRRERQIMDIVYRVGEVAVADVQAALPDPPSYSAVRALMRILEEKGHLRHREEGVKYVYLPVQARQSAARSAMRQVVQTFFGGSIEKAVSTLLSSREADLTDDELERLTAMIEKSRANRPTDKEGE